LHEHVELGFDPVRAPPCPHERRFAVEHVGAEAHGVVVTVRQPAPQAREPDDVGVRSSVREQALAAASHEDRKAFLCGRRGGGSAVQVVPVAVVLDGAAVEQGAHDLDELGEARFALPGGLHWHSAGGELPRRVPGAKAELHPTAAQLDKRHDFPGEHHGIVQAGVEHVRAEPDALGGVPAVARSSNGLASDPTWSATSTTSYPSRSVVAASAAA